MAEEEVREETLRFSETIEKLNLPLKYKDAKIKLVAELAKIENAISKAETNLEEDKADIEEDMRELGEMGEEELPTKFKSFKRNLDTLLFHHEDKETTWVEFIKALEVEDKK